MVTFPKSLDNQLEKTQYTVNLVKLATDKTLDLLLQVTSIKGFPHSVATSSPLPVASFTKLTVNSRVRTQNSEVDNQLANHCTALSRARGMGGGLDH